MSPWGHLGCTEMERSGGPWEKAVAVAYLGPYYRSSWQEVLQPMANPRYKKIGVEPWRKRVKWSVFTSSLYWVNSKFYLLSAKTCNSALHLSSCFRQVHWILDAGFVHVCLFVKCLLSGDKSFCHFSCTLREPNHLLASHMFALKLLKYEVLRIVFLMLPVP